MKKTIIFSAPYMMTSVERFRKVLEDHYGLEMIIPDVKQKLLEEVHPQPASEQQTSWTDDDNLMYTGLPVKTTSEKIIVNIGVLS